MNNSKQDYYNQEIFWEENLNSIEREKIRIDEIIRNIPADVQTILDVGCGNGAVLNNLLDKKTFKRLVGIDFSQTALNYVKTEKYLMTTENLKFIDKSFDLVICNEVLEHLTYQEYNKTLLELTRVAKSYILITIPNEEDLESLLVCCPECKSWFNQEYHVRSFSKEKLPELFESFANLLIIEIGNEKETIKYNKISRLFSVYNLNKVPTSYAKCPQCELNMSDYNTSGAIHNISFSQKFFRKLSLLFLKKHLNKYWLLSLYKRK